MTTIILADSNEAVCGALLSSLQSVRPDWHIVSHSSGIDVLQHLSTENACCILTEVDLRDMSGFELLSKLQANYPDIIRITLSGEIDPEVLRENSRVHHRFINRAVSQDILVSSVESSLRLQETLGTESLKNCMSNVGSLPSLPEIYQQMVSELTSPQSSLLNVARIIETDSALTATVLKIVNSAFYGLNQSVESVSQGVSLLGVHLIKNVTLTAKVFAQFEGGAIELQKLRQLNDNANRIGALTNQMARIARVPRTVVDYSQIAGMLSNIGELITLSSKADIAKQTSEITPDLLGAYLLKQWLLPEQVVEAVALQQESPPRSALEITPLIILHAIRHLETHYVDMKNASQHAYSQDYLEKMVPAETASRWIEVFCDVQALTAHTDIDQSHVA
ncbi:MAG: HDOD domain-containing protein [Granulosicoccus sp.]